MTLPTQLWTEIDYEAEGKQLGWLYVPHSVTRSAYGNLAIPLAVIRRGEGATLLLTAGNHGDEYEGQIALSKLLRSLQPHEIRGRVIILPAINLPAAIAGTRVSPIDAVNLNRAFPGDAQGTPTRMIAHYLDSVLFPMADCFHDLHSGGSSLNYLPFVSVWKSDAPLLDEKAMAAARAFGGPRIQIWAYSGEPRVSARAAIRRGVVTLGGEFGGGGSASPANVAIVERGLRNLMAHLGLLVEAPEKTGATPEVVEVQGRDYFVYASQDGLFEPFVQLGEEVEVGQPAGQIHFVDDPFRPPETQLFRCAGMVICQRHPARVQRGDCLAHLATKVLAT